MKTLTEYLFESQTLSCRFTYKELFDSKLYTPSADYNNDVSKLSTAITKIESDDFEIELDGIDKANNSYIIITITSNPSNAISVFVNATEQICNQLEMDCGGKSDSNKRHYTSFIEKHLDY